MFDYRSVSLMFSLKVPFLEVQQKERKKKKVKLQ